MRKKISIKKIHHRKRKSFGLIWKLPLITFLILSPFYYGYALKIIVTAWQMYRDQNRAPRYPEITDFEIPVPFKANVHGIDVSYAQNLVDWSKVKSMHLGSMSVGFAYIKSTEGLFLVDSYFCRNWFEANKAGLPCGAYHFFRADRNGYWQARFFMQVVKIKPGELPPVADIETLDGSSPGKMRQQLSAFLSYIQKNTGVQPIIYTQLNFYKRYLAGYFDNYSLWIANYNQKILTTGPPVSWQLWQCSDSARVEGINGRVDFSTLNGDSVELKKMLVKPGPLISVGKK